MSHKLHVNGTVVWLTCLAFLLHRLREKHHTSPGTFMQGSLEARWMEPGHHNDTFKTLPFRKDSAHAQAATWLIDVREDVSTRLGSIPLMSAFAP